MSGLERLICEIIRESGPIDLQRYMTLALSHPTLGYYRTRSPIGASGDFITAPEISQMFGELIGLWCIAIWSLMGEPTSLRLVELGPGRGVLMADLLRAARVAPRFLAALEVDLVETSEVLVQHQREALAGCGVPVSWRKAADEAPKGPAIFLANEFFDCLPVRHFVRGADGWRERLIGLSPEGRLCFGLAPEPEAGLVAPGAPGDVLEISEPAARLMSELATRVRTEGGAVLIIDYGYAAPSRGETLQAVKRHQYVDPLADPGEADLTAHVNFGALARTARAAGAAVHGPLEQGEFLARLGIFERAAILRRRADAGQAAAIESALERLAGPGPVADTHMARLFKVLAACDPGLPTPPGFEALAT